MPPGCIRPGDSPERTTALKVAWRKGRNDRMLPVGVRRRGSRALSPGIRGKVERGSRFNNAEPEEQGGMAHPVLPVGRFARGLPSTHALEKAVRNGLSGEEHADDSQHTFRVPGRVRSSPVRVVALAGRSFHWRWSPRNQRSPHGRDLRPVDRAVTAAVEAVGNAIRKNKEFIRSQNMCHMPHR